MNIPQIQKKFPTAIKILSEVVVAHVGWDMDNTLWLVEFKDGSKTVIGTSHGGLYRVTRADVGEQLEEACQRTDDLKEFYQNAYLIKGAM